MTRHNRAAAFAGSPSTAGLASGAGQTQSQMCPTGMVACDGVVVKPGG